MFWGAIRDICTNGMVFGDVLSKFYSKHTSGINLGNLKQQLEQTYDQIPVIKERIEILKHLRVTDKIKKDVEDTMGKKIAKYIEYQSVAKNQWVMYNMITFYISHVIAQRMRASYQMKASKLFRL